MKRLLAVLVLIVSASGFCMAQNNPYVTCTYTLSKNPDSLYKGDFVKLFIEVKPNPNMRVYSAQPSPKKTYTPAELTFDIESRGVIALEGLKEEGILFTEYDDIAGGTQRYYKKPVKFIQQLRITEDNWKIRADFDYMAGDGDVLEVYTLKVNINPSVERPTEEIPDDKPEDGTTDDGNTDGE